MRHPFRAAPAVFLLLTLVHAAILYAQPAVPDAEEPFAPHEIDHRLLLIGDAGAPKLDGEPALTTLNVRASELPTKTTVVFLGDNVYETGMPDISPIGDTPAEEILDDVLLNLFESRGDAEARLDLQVNAVTSAGASAIFVPGNHDWDQFGVGGWDRIRALGAYIDELQAEGDTEIALVPAGGCPGPATVDLGTRLRLIALDTQWWLDAGVGGKPGPDENPTGCKHLTETEVRRGLEKALTTAGDRESVIVAHHPISSNGPHGGYYPVFVHFFPLHMLSTYVPQVAHWIPLPILGSAMVWARQWRSPTVQDLSNGLYTHMREELILSMEIARLSGDAPLLFAAGHDHSLQVFEEPFGPTYSVVSGLGSSVKASPVGHSGASLYTHSDSERPGLMQLDFATDGRIRLAVFIWDPIRHRPRESFARELTPAPPPEAGSPIP